MISGADCRKKRTKWLLKYHYFETREVQEMKSNASQGILGASSKYKVSNWILKEKSVKLIKETQLI